MHRRVRAFCRTYGPAPPSVASQPELVATQSDAAGRLVGSSAEGWPHVRGTPPATPDQGSRPRPSAPIRHRPSTRGPYRSSRFRSPHARRRRWEKDGWLGDDSGQLAVALLDDTLAGIVAWRSIETGGPDGGCLEIGAPWCFPSTAAGLGTAAQGLLVEYLFATTLANRLQAITNVENLAEQRALERIGFRREGVMRGLAFDGGRWHDGALYARLRYDPA
jgi:ribosomal-protein-alanine N-acetyltransferase